MKKEKSYISYLAIPILFVLIILLAKVEIINPYWYQIIQLSCINGIVAMSLNQDLCLWEHILRPC